jgi:hypothetical protein
MSFLFCLYCIFVYCIDIQVGVIEVDITHVRANKNRGGSISGHRRDGGLVAAAVPNTKKFWQRPSLSTVLGAPKGRAAHSPHRYTRVLPRVKHTCSIAYHDPLVFGIMRDMEDVPVSAIRQEEKEEEEDAPLEMFIPVKVSAPITDLTDVTAGGGPSSSSSSASSTSSSSSRKRQISGAPAELSTPDVGTERARVKREKNMTSMTSSAVIDLT